MAKRPIFIPTVNQFPFIKEVIINFDWYSGFAKTQTQKSIRSLHKEASKLGVHPILEISSKSETPLGVSLSAFNLMLQYKGIILSVECAFQGSKVFKSGGPYTDLYHSTSIDAKKDTRIKESGELIGFNFFGEEFPTKPFTSFYDWLYIYALTQNASLATKLPDYAGYSDIAFNPEKSINCQARSAAMFVGFIKSPSIDINRLVNEKKYYLSTISTNFSPINNSLINPTQLTWL